MLAWIAAVAAKDGLIRSGVPWYDTEGRTIDAHGGGMLQVDGTTFWYGSKRDRDAPGTQMDGGIALYSSPDLVTWTY